MKAIELMIGDWYAFRGHPYKCTASDIASIAECEEKGAPTDISEIPLTPEILEKNGFEKLDFSHYHINNRALVLDADGKWEGPLSWHWVVTEMSTNAKGQPVVLDYYVATINYVHELQHALRLCGIEKEIML